MPLVNTVRGRSSVMTWESGSIMSGRSQMKYGLSIVERPDRQGYPCIIQTQRETAMNKTVLITGCSSGYGLETARHFHAQGWNVVATMRTLREDVLHESERLRVLALDVT